MRYWILSNGRTVRSIRLLPINSAQSALFSYFVISLVVRFQPENSLMSFTPTLFHPQVASGEKWPRSYLPLDGALLVPANNKNDFVDVCMIFAS